MIPPRIGVLASGGGSNFEALVTASRTQGLGGAEVACLVVPKAGVGALDRATRLGIDSLVVSPKGYPTRDGYNEALAQALLERGVSVVCLAGYLLKVEPVFLRAFPDRVLNIHPALLPKYGGAGMYGHFVHEAVLRAGETESGCTVHLVDKEFDRGPILAQARVPVLPDDTPERLAARVLVQEHILYPKTVAAWIQRRTA